MFFVPITYDEPLFRPPAEARSAIIQATLGCSWNQCTFCEMYTSKKFKARSIEDVKSDISNLAGYYKGVKKIFLADGNAFVLSAKKLIPILDEINKKFGKIQRVSSYALPKDILSKSEQELKELKDLGLKLLYIGIETGDEELLKLIHKGETFNSTVDGITKAHKIGIDTSIMIINGLGGKVYSEQHALKSAEIINKVNPKFLSTLTLSLPYGLEHFQNRFEGCYQQQTIVELFKELRLFIKNLEPENVIYRSNHVSNNIPLQGTLSKDKDVLLMLLEKAINNTDPEIFPSQSDIL